VYVVFIGVGVDRVWQLQNGKCQLLAGILLSSSGDQMLWYTVHVYNVHWLSGLKSEYGTFAFEPLYSGHAP